MTDSKKATTTRKGSPDYLAHVEGLRQLVQQGTLSRQDLISSDQWPIKWHHRQIESIQQVKDCLRAGAYAWPGGYPLYFITADSEPLSFEAVAENFRQVCEAMEPDYFGSPDWRIVALEENWEDNELRCSHTEERIESAYAEED